MTASVMICNPDGSTEIQEMSRSDYEAIYGPTPTENPLSGLVFPISPRQFFLGMTKEPYAEITEEQCRAMLVSNIIPQPMLDALDLAESVDLLPGGMSRFDAEMLIIRAGAYEVDNPISEAIAIALGWTKEKQCEFWKFALTL